MCHAGVKQRQNKLKQDKVDISNDMSFYIDLISMNRKSKIVSNKVNRKQLTSNYLINPKHKNLKIYTFSTLYI